MAKLTLTRPQWFLLADIVNGDCHALPEYPPAKRLVAPGYAEWDSRYSNTLRPTDAGRAALTKDT